MKCILFLLVASLFANKQRIGVLPFEIRNELGIEKASLVIPDLLIQYLLKSEFIVEERLHLNEVIQEQSLAQSGFFSEEQIVELGKVQKVDGLVVGQGMRLGGSIYISARLVNVETGTIQSSGSIQIPANKDIATELEGLAWILKGNSINDFQNEITKRKYDQNRVLLKMGSGWGFSLFEEWHQESEKGFVHEMQRSDAVAGLLWEMTYENLHSEFSFGYINPGSFYGAWLDATWYPFTQIGLAGRVLYIDADQMKGETIYSGGRFQSYTLGLRFRLNEKVKFSVQKGLTLDDESFLRYQNTEQRTPALQVSERFHFLHGPTLATVFLQLDENFNLSFLYYHNLERSVLVEDSVYTIDSKPTQRDVSGFYRIMALSVGYQFDW